MTSITEIILKNRGHVLISVVRLIEVAQQLHKLCRYLAQQMTSSLELNFIFGLGTTFQSFCSVFVNS